MFNYAIDPRILAPLVPPGTELDLHQGETYVSIVAFLFLRTRVLGMPIPFHCNFEEVNLRFYVRRREGGEIRRGVSFIQELVPRRAIAVLANALYNEHYRTARMSHRIERTDGRMEAGFGWKLGGKEHSLWMAAEGDAQALEPGSLDQFIAEHYWGYAAQRDGGSMEYAVRHVPWMIRRAASYTRNINVASLYGPEFKAALSQTPRSVFLAEGSAVTVSRGRRIPGSPSQA